MILIVCPTPALQRRMRFRRIISGGVNRALETEILPSGKGINAARAILSCGGDPKVLQFLGGDTGRVMRRMLREARITSQNVEIKARTRFCETLQESQSGMVTELVENAGAVKPKEVRALMLIVQRNLARAKVLLGMGSLPPGTPLTFYRDLARMARKVGKPCIVDAQGKALMLCLSARPLLVKPNRDELAATTGVNTHTRSGLKYSVKRLHETGAQWVLITDGANPALLSDGTRIEDIRIEITPARNPVGSGDSLAGGLALALSKGYSMGDAVRMGIGCGMANAAGGGYGFLDATISRRFSRKIL